MTRATSAFDPKSRFAALRRYVRSRGQTGLVTDWLETSKMTQLRHWQSKLL
jgi:P2-related tail formation protein